MSLKIRPPKTPRNENPTVTIANQDRQINMLLSRVEQLTEESDDWRRKFEGQFKVAGSLAEEIGKLQAVVARMEGWRDCAREIIGSMELPLISTLP